MLRSIVLFTAVTVCAAAPALAATVPFTEEFSTDASNWAFNSTGTIPLDWSPNGGPGDSAHVSYDFNFQNSVLGDNPAIFRGQDNLDSSGDAFVGNWLTDGVTEFSAMVYHEAPLPLNFFTRFTSPVNFPGAIGLEFVPVLPNTWTEISVAIDPLNPQFVTFEGSDFNSVFSNIGGVQIGVTVPAELEGVDMAYTFALDNPTIVPEPASAALLLLGGGALLRRRNRRPFGRRALTFAAPMVIAVVSTIAAPAARAGTFTFSPPTDDRWWYPFNFTPGTRELSSNFGATGVPNFNDRDGCTLIVWDTTTQIAPGQGESAYDIASIRVTVAGQSGLSWLIDTTVDEWFTYDLNNDTMENGDGLPRTDPNDTDGESDDLDPGRPIELFGVGFGPFSSESTWHEGSGYEGAADDAQFARDPFPFAYQDGTGIVLHVEDSVKGFHNEPTLPDGVGFTPTPWAVGVPTGYTPGAQATAFPIDFDIDLSLSDGLVKSYFQQQLDAGRVFIMITSLDEAEVMGGTQMLPVVWTKEGANGETGAFAPVLEITFAAAVFGDFDNDGDVDLGDFAQFSLCFAGANMPPAGSCPPGIDADADSDGDVDLSDFAAFSLNFTGSL